MPPNPGNALARNRAKGSRAAQLACAAVLAAAHPALADKYWTATDGSWLDPAWSLTPGGPADQQPPSAPGENAFITFNDPLPRTVTYVNPGFTNTLGALTLDNTAGGVSSLAQSQDRFAAQEIVIGRSGQGSYTLAGGSIQNGKSAVNSYFAVGSNAGSTGAFTQTGGTATLGGSAYFGYSGNATVNLSGGTLSATNTASKAYVAYGRGSKASFTQTGGTFDVRQLDIGYASGSSGSYTLSGSASLLTGGALWVGVSGTGTLSQTGGAVAFDSVNVGGGGRGTYNLSAGNITADFLKLANLGGGTFNQSGGTVTVLSLSMGNPSSGNAVYSLSNGATLVVDSGATMGGGSGSRATINQTGGSVTFNGIVYFGQNGAATYNLSGGTLAGGMTIGQGGIGSVGTINHTGGTYNAGSIRLGNTGGSVGAYAMSNAATLNIAYDLQVAFAGTGSFTQTGGSTTLRGQLVVGYAGGTGTLNLTGGVLSATNSATLLSAENGDVGYATVNHAGGTFVTKSLTMGGYRRSGATGPTATYALTGPDATLNVLNDMRVGTAASAFFDGGAATYTQTAGNANVGTTLSIGDAPTSSGTVTLGGGTLTVRQVYVGGGTNGAGGTGRLILNGGTLVTSSVTVFNTPGSGVTLDGTATLRLATNPTRLASTIGALSLAGSGTLDLGNGVLQLDNAKTSTSSVVAALKQAYNFNAQTKFGRWDGPGSLTSSDAVASVTAGAGNVTVAYVDGAIQNKYPGLDLHNTLGGPTLATNRTLVRAALMGDVNLDGKVNGDDISVIAQFGRYNKTAPDGWVNGDLNYDGLVNGDDISLIAQTRTYNAATVYGNAAASPAPAAASADLAAASTIGVSGDKVFDYVYDRSTGSLSIQYDGDANINGDTPLATLKVLSAAGRINVTVANQNRPAGVTRPFTTTANEITWTFFEPADGTFPDGYSFGAILPTGLTAAQVLSDLDLSYARSGALGYTTADLVVVPEPASLTALALAAATTLLARRRRRRQGQLR